jgi:N-acetylneuraminic acid mutarotase
MTTRRINKALREFFEKQTLTEEENSFILSILRNQKNWPQLTHRQWEKVCEIKERYKDVKVSRSEETS